MDSKYQISVGFFPDFKFHDPAILFWGSSEALRRFAEFLRGTGPGQNGIFLNDETWINPIRGIRIWFEMSEPGLGMVRAPGDRETDFSWRITASQVRRFADQIESLALSQKPGHHYLDCEAKDEFVVMVSMGEYDGLEKNQE